MIGFHHIMSGFYLNGLLSFSYAVRIM